MLDFRMEPHARFILQTDEEKRKKWQRALDHLCEGMKRQNWRKCVDRRNLCAYALQCTDGNWMHCAVGQLIDFNKISREEVQFLSGALDDKIDGEFIFNMLPLIVEIEDDCDFTLLCELQEYHDNTFALSVKSRIETFAYEYGLNFKE